MGEPYLPCKLGPLAPKAVLGAVKWHDLETIEGDQRTSKLPHHAHVGPVVGGVSPALDPQLEKPICMKTEEIDGTLFFLLINDHHLILPLLFFHLTPVGAGHHDFENEGTVRPGPFETGIYNLWSPGSEQDQGPREEIAEVTGLMVL
jgi:hypothetical protein